MSYLVRCSFTNRFGSEFSWMFQVATNDYRVAFDEAVCAFGRDSPEANGKTPVKLFISLLGEAERCAPTHGPETMHNFSHQWALHQRNHETQTEAR